MFIILNFTQPEVPDVVYLEGPTGKVYLEDLNDVATYKATYGALAHLAADTEAKR
jgi:hypothetical protein